MTPTPEQVAQWASEAGLTVGRNVSGIQLVGAGMHGALLIHLDVNDLHRLVTRAMAEQAEADAKLCDIHAENYTADDEEARADGAGYCAHSIRVNAPKVTT